MSLNQDFQLIACHAVAHSLLLHAVMHTKKREAVWLKKMASCLTIPLFNFQAAATISCRLTHQPIVQSYFKTIVPTFKTGYKIK